MRRLTYALGFVVIAIMGGNWLTQVLTPYPMEMPLPLYHFIVFVLRITGNSDLDNPEDMETIGVACLLVACCVFSALVLWIGSTVLRQCLSRRRRI
jgi:hypothetical protein